MISSQIKWWIFIAAGAFLAIYLVVLLLKRMYGYDHYVCTSCGGDFKYQSVAATVCPDCGGLLEDVNELVKSRNDGDDSLYPRP